MKQGDALTKSGTHWKQTIGGEQIGHPLQMAIVVVMVDAPIYMEKTTFVNRESGFEGVLTAPLVSVVYKDVKLDLRLYFREN